VSWNDYIQRSSGRLRLPSAGSPDGLHFDPKCYRVYVNGQPLQSVGGGEAFHRIALGGFAAAGRHAQRRRWLSHLHRQSKPVDRTICRRYRNLCSPPSAASPPIPDPLGKAHFERRRFCFSIQIIVAKMDAAITAYKLFFRQGRLPPDHQEVTPHDCRWRKNQHQP
jgi:hypothetical protein